MSHHQQLKSVKHWISLKGTRQAAKMEYFHRWLSAAEDISWTLLWTHSALCAKTSKSLMNGEMP